MSFIDILNQYASRPPDQPAPAAEQHFEQVAEQAPPRSWSFGPAEALRS